MVRVKICGITSATDSEQATLLGADAIGLNFYARSPRCIDVTRAASILRELPPFVDAVGLFVNLPLRQVFGEAQRHRQDVLRHRARVGTGIAGHRQPLRQRRKIHRVDTG